MHYTGYKRSLFCRNAMSVKQAVETSVMAVDATYMNKDESIDQFQFYLD